MPRSGHVRSARGIATSLAVMLVAGIAATAIPRATRAAAADFTVNCPNTPAGQLIVRGSVNQIHIINGGIGSVVTASGPSPRSGTTDSAGGLVFRNVTQGTYTVTVAGTAHPGIKVLGEGDTPTDALYDQVIDPETFVPGRAVDGYLTMRDCTKLSYRIEFPDGGYDPDIKYDVVVTYSGYSPSVRPGFAFEQDDSPQSAFPNFKAEGYAVIGVNMRGSGCSGGAFDLMERQVAVDGYDMIETIDNQSWVDNVAMADKSWPGLSQLFVAAKQPPGLDAIAPGAPVADFYRDFVYPGGIENIGWAKSWAHGRDETEKFPGTANTSVAAITDGVGGNDDPVCLENQKLRGQNVSTEDSFDDYPLYTSADKYWPDRKYWSDRTAAVGLINVPTLMVVSWQDEQVGSRAADALRWFAPGVARLVGTNGGHGAYYGHDVFEHVKQFLCVYLKNDGTCGITKTQYVQQDPITILVGNDRSGNAQSEYRLPNLEFVGPGDTWTLGSRLLADDPDSPPTSSTFTYEPAPSVWDQVRQDMATFTSAPLANDVVMAGTGSADLWISAPQNDVDLQVMVSEVRADGNEMFVQSGWLRASHRALAFYPGVSTPLRPYHPHDASVALPHNTLKEVRIELGPFAHVFKKDSSLRLTVSGPGSSGTAGLWNFETVTPEGVAIKVAHDASHPSALVLPLVTPASIVPAPVLPACPEVPPTSSDIWSQPCRQYFVVDRLTDANDSTPSDGLCKTAANDCSLRAAIQQGNALPGTATIRLSPATYTLSLSAAGDTGGDLDVSDATFIDGRSATIDGLNATVPNPPNAPIRDRVFEVTSGASLALDHVTVTRGSSDLGGGIKVDGCDGAVCSRVDLVDSVLTNNTAVYGGGLYVGANTASATVTGGSVSLNTALLGGGIYSSGKIFTLRNTTIGSNTAGWYGGGVHADAGIQVFNTLVINNKVNGSASGIGGGISIGTTAAILGFPSKIDGSLIIYNSAVGASTEGGGVLTLKPVSISWSTVAGNSAAAGADLAARTSPSGPASRFDLLASIMWDKFPSDNSACSGTMHSLGFNIDSGTSCALSAGTDLSSTNPLLGPWGDLGTGSPAIDSAGTGCKNIFGGQTVDLHGTDRPQHAICDRGAIERPYP